MEYYYLKMLKDKENNYQSLRNKKFKIDILADLSIVDLITLELLLKKHIPVVRYSLYVEVKQFFADYKKIFTSSFYKNLKDLEKKGLISFNRSKNHKDWVENIEATPLAEAAIKGINQYFMSAVAHNSNIANEEILAKLDKKYYDKLLIVSINDYLNLDLFPFLMKNFNSIYIITRKDVYQDLQEIGIKNIKRSNIEDCIIREPNDFFDVTAIPFYFKKPYNYDMTRVEILKELRRTTKPGGWTIISSRSKLPETNNYFANEILKLYREAVKERIFTEQEFREDLQKAGYSHIETFKHNGVVAGVARKTSQ